MKNKINSFIIIVFLSFQMYGQSNTIKVNRNGIEFPNGTQQESAAQQNNNNGGDLIQYVIADFSDNIDGDFTQDAFTDVVKVLSIQHEVFRNLNSNGAPESTQHHNRFVFTKNIDSASTDLLSKWNSNTKINEIDFKFIRPHSSGSYEEFYNIKLIDVKIVEMTTHLDYSHTQAAYIPFETIHVVYNTIEYEHVVNTTSQLLNNSY